MTNDRTVPVTVVIAAYNQVDLLGSTVASVIEGQPDVPIVIVVDACPFGTDHVARTLQDENPDRISVIVLERNRGQAGARNIGLAHVKTPWVHFLDGDDRVEPGALGALASLADASSTPPGVVLGRFDRINGDTVRIDPGSAERDHDPHHVVRKGHRVPSALSLESFVTSWFIGPPGAWLLDAALVAALGGFDESLRNWEDLEFVARLLPVATVLEAKVLVLHKRIHSQQVSGGERFFNVHGWRLRSCWRALRRAAPTDVPAILRGMQGNCLALADAPAPQPGRRADLRRAMWRLAAHLVPAMGLAARGVRRATGPLAPPPPIERRTAPT